MNALLEMAAVSLPGALTLRAVMSALVCRDSREMEPSAQVGDRNIHIDYPSE